MIRMVRAQYNTLCNMCVACFAFSFDCLTLYSFCIQMHFGERLQLKIRALHSALDCLLFDKNHGQSLIYREYGQHQQQDGFIIANGTTCTVLEWTFVSGLFITTLFVPRCLFSSHFSSTLPALLILIISLFCSLSSYASSKKLHQPQLMQYKWRQKKC